MCQVSEASPLELLHLLSGNGGPLLSVCAAAPVVTAPGALRRALRLLRRCLCSTDPRSNVGLGGDSVPVISTWCGLFPPRHSLPHLSTNWR